MKYKYNLEEDFLIVTLSGDLIGEENGPEIIKELEKYNGKGNLQVIIDISDVRYINSSGIGVLITMLTKVRNKGGELCLINPSESVKKLLIITKLQAIFKVFDTIPNAKTKLQAQINEG
ncbi:MAG: STAS domain-containing protein [Bacteroidota bacterium]